MDMQHEMTEETGLSAASGGAREGTCLLLTINDKHMLVPRNIVAEVIRYSFLRLSNESRSGFPEFEWRGCQVPHPGGSMFGGNDEIGINDDTRVAVFYGLRNMQVLPFYAFTITRSPQLLRLGEGDLEEVKGAELHPGELMRVSIGNAEAFIPRVDHFETTIIDKMKQQADG